MYTPNQGYIKQLLTEVKGETDKNTVIVGELNILLTALDRSSKQKINIEILVLYDTLYHMDIIDIYRAFYTKTSDYTFFSSAHGTFPRTDYILGHKTASTNSRRLNNKLNKGCEGTYILKTTKCY